MPPSRVPDLSSRSGARYQKCSSWAPSAGSRTKARPVRPANGNQRSRTLGLSVQSVRTSLNPTAHSMTGPQCVLLCGDVCATKPAATKYWPTNRDPAGRRAGLLQSVRPPVLAGLDDERPPARRHGKQRAFGKSRIDRHGERWAGGAAMGLTARLIGASVRARLDGHEHPARNQGTSPGSRPAVTSDRRGPARIARKSERWPAARLGAHHSR